MTLNEEPVGVYSLLHRIVGSFDSHAQYVGVELSVEVKTDRALQVLFDKEKYTKVVNNLISNALKFTPSSGRVQVRLLRKKENLLLEVEDNGRGIHEKDLPFVFDRYYQSQQPDAPVEGGTGIGLALSRELARLMKGELNVESTQGQGSCFYFSIPLHEAKGPLSEDDLVYLDQSPSEPGLAIDQEDMAMPGATIASKAARILVVEDNASLSAYLQEVLEETYHVDCVKNGAEALRVLQSNEQAYSLVLSDIMMPVMDGFELLRRLKSDERFGLLPVIILSARADSKDKLTALRIGVDDYLIKPFEEEELRIRIKNLLRHAANRIPDDSSDEMKGEVTGGAGGDFSEGAKAANLSISKEDQQWLEEVEAITIRYLDDFSFTLDFMASKLMISRRQLFRRLKKLTGLTPHQYLVEVRLQKAREYLETRKYTYVKNVAYSVGFKDVDYFSKKYKARFGKLPSEYG